MKRKPGAYNFTGRLDHLLSIYIDKNGDEIMRKKGGPNKEQIKKLPQFEELRRNMSDFGKASRFGKFLRTIVFPPLLQLVPETTLSGRLTAHVHKLIRQNERDENGFRSITEQNIRKFGTFYLDKQNTKELVSVNSKREEDGHCTLSISTKAMAAPEEATHYQVTSFLYEYQPVSQMRQVLESSLRSLPSSTGEEILQYHFEFTEKSIFFHGTAIVFFAEADGEYRKLTGNGVNGGWISELIPGK